MNLKKLTYIILSFNLITWCSIFFLASPVPTTYDEFGHLLVADTLTNFRLCNPVPNGVEFFDSFGVILSPYYYSRYPIGIGATLAVGQFLGHPLLGMLILLIVFHWAAYRFVINWFNESTGTLALIILLMNPTILLSWSLAYWGGLLTHLAGTLIVGSIPKFNSKTSWQTALLTGSGFAILALTRPFEGALVMLPILILIIQRTFLAANIKLAILSLPIIFALGLTTAQNKICVGSITHSPYFTYDQNQASVPAFVYMKEWGLKDYKTPKVSMYYTKDYATTRAHSSSPMLWSLELMERIGEHFGRYLPAYSELLLLGLPYLRTPGVGYLILSLIFSIISITITTHYYPHYSSPAIAITLLLPLLIFQKIQTKYLLSQKIFKLLVSLLLVSIIWKFYNYQSTYIKHRQEGIPRAKVIEYLNQQPGKELVFVKYQNSNSYFEWVFNSANPSNQEIIWAHSFDNIQNKLLEKYYPEHSTWELILTDTEYKLHQLNKKPNKKSDFIYFD